MTDIEQPSTIDWKNRLFQYFLLNQRKIFQYSAGVLAIALLAIFWGTRDLGTEQKSLAVVDQWKKSPGDETLTREMEKALKTAPHLRQILEAEIAQIFLNIGDVEKAGDLAAGGIARLNEGFPLHAEFARISLLIEQEKYQAALEASVTLKERLEMGDAGSQLQGWNLLRLAFLQKKLQNPSGEFAAWGEVKGFIARHPAGKSLEVAIGRPDFSLSDFIAHREREIDRS